MSVKLFPMLCYGDRARALLAILVAFLFPATVAAASAQGIRVELYTIGPGNYLFSKFGHAALCVSDAAWRQSRCFNYGTADFSTPGPLTWAVLRGRAEFWVSVSSLDEMKRLYRAEDRTIYRQVLPLSAEEAAAVERALLTSARPENRRYRYDHFLDNCSTRPRDHIDQATGGALRPDPASSVEHYTFRALIRRSLESEPLFFLLAEAFLGRPLDRKRSEFEAMFLPRILREAVRRHLQVAPTIVHARQGPGFHPSWIVTHRLLLAVGTGLAGGLVLFLGSPRLSSGLRRLFALMFGTLGLVGWTLALLSPLPELRHNETLLVFLPSDFLLLLGSERLSRHYATLRAGGLILIGLLHWQGVLIQPLGMFLALTWPVLVGIGARALATSPTPR